MYLFIYFKKCLRTTNMLNKCHNSFLNYLFNLEEYLDILK